MLLEMITVRRIDRHRATATEIVISYLLAKRPTTSVDMMILSLQADSEKKLGELRENTYLLLRAPREREHLKALVINNLLSLYLAPREREKLTILPIPRPSSKSPNRLNKSSLPQIMSGKDLLDCLSRKTLLEN
ncbi:hypothetical protein YC2023_071475 [Brassica napus]